MNITNHEHMLVFDFCRPGASWALLISDDRWDHVKRMVCGNPQSSDPSDRGLANNAVILAQVTAYWKPRMAGQVEVHLLSLLLMPWVAHQEPTIGKVVFSSFPPKSAEALKSLLDPKLHLAAMIDVLGEAGDESSRRSYFAETWCLLDQVEKSPPSARCMFTRGGGLDLIPQFCHVPRLLKVVEFVEPEKFQATFHRRWQCIQGDLSTGNAVYQKETLGTLLHDPSTLSRPEVAMTDIRFFFEAMAAFDSYGAWRRCESLLGQNVTLPFQRAWLAAKALQTCPQAAPKGSNVRLKLPVTGLIALVHGLNVFRPNHPYAVESMLDTIAAKDIDCIPIFKAIPIPAGLTPQSLATALRNWINHEEQFPEGRARVVRAKFSLEDTTVNLALTYSSALPDRVVTPTDKIGNARSALTELEKFAQISWDSGTQTLNISFSRES